MKTFFVLLILLGSAVVGMAQTSIPAVLSDKIHRGSGAIDILRDVRGNDLSSYLSQNGSLFLGIDINERANAPASPNSQGVAVQEMRLLLQTTTGDFSFGDFYTSTTAMIRGRGASEPQEFFTLFGQTGSSQLTSSTNNFDLSPWDDVITIDNIAFSGEILSAELQVKFLDTESRKGAGINEQFFDFSAGFEDFAILTRADAQVLEAASIGQGAAPEGLAFASVETPLSQSADGGGQNPSAPGGSGGGAQNPGSAAPGAPAPPLLLLIFGALLLAVHQWKQRKAAISQTS